MDRRFVRKLDLHFSILWGLYWIGWAAIWGFLSVFLLHRGFTNSQVGMVSSCALLLPIVVQPALASLTDRSPRFTSRRLAMALTAAALVSGAGVWLVDGPVLCAVCFIIIGVALTAIAPYFNAMSMDFVLRGVDVNFSASRSCGSVTYALSSLALGAALEHYAPTLVLPVFLLSFGALLLALLLFRHPLPAPQADAAKAAPAVLSNAALLRRYPAFTLLLVGCALLMASHSPVTTYMIHIVGKAGGGESELGVALFLSAAVELPAMLLFSRLRRRFSLRVLMLVCAASFAVRNAAFLLAASPIAVYIACMLQFFEYAIFIPATVYYVTEEIDTANQVKGQALIYTASSGIGSALGTLCSGRLLDSAGVNGMLLFCLCSALLGTAVTILSLYSKRLKGGQSK